MAISSSILATNDQPNECQSNVGIKEMVSVLKYILQVLLSAF